MVIFSFHHIGRILNILGLFVYHTCQFSPQLYCQCVAYHHGQALLYWIYTIEQQSQKTCLISTTSIVMHIKPIVHNPSSIRYCFEFLNGLKDCATHSSTTCNLSKETCLTIQSFKLNCNACSIHYEVLELANPRHILNHLHLITAILNFAVSTQYLLGMKQRNLWILLLFTMLM